MQDPEDGGTRFLQNVSN